MRIVLFYIFFGFSTMCLAQDLSGIWRGVLTQNGYSTDKGSLLYLDLHITDGTVTGTSRDEIYNTETFALKNLKGTQKNGVLELQQSVITKKTSPSKTNWCKFNMVLMYNKTTGYLEGTYTSSDCRNAVGKVILYRTESKFSDGEKAAESHHWFDVLVQDLKKGLNAPEIRKKERENFVFQPIYFDYDQSDIKPEFYDFLDRMIKVVEGHSDLRVKVTGHTDSDGSNAYNDGLSQRRAQAIIDYFVSKGLSADRLVFDFKGENDPVDTNDTPEGRQRNRRVDFRFI